MLVVGRNVSGKPNPSPSKASSAYLHKHKAILDWEVRLNLVAAGDRVVIACLGVSQTLGIPAVADLASARPWNVYWDPVERESSVLRGPVNRRGQIDLLRHIITAIKAV